MGFFKKGKSEKAAEPAGGGGGRAGQVPATQAAEVRSAGVSSQVAAVSNQLDQKPERKKKSKSDDGGGTGSDSGAAAGSSTVGGSSASGAKVGAASGPSVNDFISKTKTQQRKGLKPSGPELIAYARYLGIDPVADHDLLWIAVEALEAPLPSEWTEHFDSNDRVFYYNATTRISSWTHPLEHVYRETYEIIVHFRNSNMAPDHRSEHLIKLQKECEQQERDVHREIGLWTEHSDEHGHRFYYNSEVKQSTWTDPRPAKCHVLYLKMKMIRVLESCMRNQGHLHTHVGHAAHPAHAASEAKDHGSSRFAPLSPRRDREDLGAGAHQRPNGAGGDGVTKRPKVTGDSDGRGGERAIDATEWGVGGSAPAAELSSVGDDNSVLNSPTEMEAEDHKKKKKKKKRDLSAPGDARGEGGPTREKTNLNHSQSEPSVGGKVPPPSIGAAGVDEVRTGLGPHPSVPIFPNSSFEQSESLSTVGRARVKAGIRLVPLGASPPGIASDLSAAALSQPPGHGGMGGLGGSASVPELKPLEKLQPL